MRRFLNRFLRDETGAIITAEFIIIATVVVLALVTGWNAVSGALVGELADVATAFGSLDQSYNYRGIKAVSRTGEHAHCSGSGFNDSGNQLALTTNIQTIAGGFSTKGISTTGGFAAIGGFNGGSVNGGVGVAAAAPAGAAAASAASTPAANVVEGAFETEEIISRNAVGEVANSAVVSSRILSVSPMASDAAAARAFSVKKDDCERLKDRIRALCKELSEIEEASTVPANLSPSPAP